jgi:uncharacterized protein
MNNQVFINFPVRDLARSIAFFKALGFIQNFQVTDKDAACIVVSKAINVMLLTHRRFTEFASRQIADTAKSSEVMLCLAVESRAKVHAIADAALASGGSPVGAPQEHGFLFGRSFADPDGHIWEIIWIDPVQRPL